MILLKRLRLSSILFSVMSSYNIWSYLVVVTMMVTMVVTVTMVMVVMLLTTRCSLACSSQEENHENVREAVDPGNVLWQIQIQIQR